ncbi:Protein T24H10.4 [Aphelenchoides avenae]|nr:Protein T24H10.4 [Aphelenchus avenae]
MGDSTENIVVRSPTQRRPKPLIVLFGWAGCQDRYLAKYSQFYEEKGYSTVRFTVPISEVRGFSCYRKFALEVYETVLDQDLEGPVFFHLFSMNGCSLFTALWIHLDTVSNGQAIRDLVKGLIFDSSPADVLPWQTANAISFASLPPSAYSSLSRCTYRALLTGVFSVHRAMIWLRSNFEEDFYSQVLAYYRLLRIPDLPKDQLYLYSEADDICSSHSIDAFQEAQKDRSCRVRSQCWPDSPHCQHLRQYPEEYSGRCLDFVEEVLKD